MRNRTHSSLAACLSAKYII